MKVFVKAISNLLTRLPVLLLSLITILFMLVYNKYFTVSFDENLYFEYVNQEIKVEGYVLSEVVKKEKSQVFDISVKTLLYKNKTVKFTQTVRVFAPRYPEMKQGENIVVTGKIEYPKDYTDEFSYKGYLSNKGIYFVMYNPKIEHGKYGISLLYKALLDIRCDVVDKMNRYLPEPHSSLLSGILLGVKNAMPEGFSEALRRTGTTHVIAASGYNVTLVANFIVSGLKMINRRLRIIVGIAFVWVFVIISGASIPVVRAAIMTTMTFTALFFGRASNVAQSLIFSAAIMILKNPRVVNDISFQLSFASTCGLIYIDPIMKKLLSFLPEIVKDTLSTTFSAVISTFPITAANFGSFSIISPISNVLVLPVVEIVMALGTIFVIVPTFLKILVTMLSLVVWIPLDYFVKAVNLLSGLSFASIEVPKFSYTTMFLCYLLIVLFIVFGQNKLSLEEGETFN